MKVLFLIVNDPDYLEDVLSILTNHGVRGATILESQGMGSTIVNNGIKDMPIFGTLKSMLKDSHVYNKTIFSVINEEDKLKNVLSDLKKLKEENESGVGLMFTMPIDDFHI